MKKYNDLVVEMKERGFTHEQINQKVHELHSKDSQKQRENYYKRHKAKYGLLFIGSFLVFFLVWALTQIEVVNLQTILITSLVSIFFAFFPVTAYYFLSNIQKADDILEKKIHKNTEKIILYFGVAFILFYLSAHWFKTQSISVHTGLLSVLIVLGIYYYFSFTYFLSKIFKDRRQFLYRIVLLTAGGLLLIILAYDILFFIIASLILYHWYVYTSKAVTTMTATRNLMIFFTSFFIISFFLILVRMIDTTLILTFELPSQNIYSYILLSFGLTILFYVHIFLTKHLLVSQFSTVREKDYFGRLNPILSFDARYSNNERTLLRALLFIVATLLFLLLLVIWYNVLLLF
ncbi:MAG: hypothetical protein ACMXYA_00915 [Candidatus Woesearchaeota archaeon]